MPDLPPPAPRSSPAHSPPAPGDNGASAAELERLRAENAQLVAENAKLQERRARPSGKEKRRLRKRLASVAERLQRVVESSGEGIFDWVDTRREDIFFSGRFYEILGYAEEEPVTTRAEVFALIHPDDRETALATAMGCISAETTGVAEVRFRTRSSGYRWCEVTGTAGRDPETGQTRLTGGVRDIDGRKRLQVANAALLERLNLVVAGARAGVYDWPDTRESYIALSQGFLELLGFDEGEVTHTLDFFWTLIHPEDEAHVEAALGETLTHGAAFDAEYRIRFKGHGYRWIRSTASIVHDSTPEGAHRLTGSLIDIHDAHIAADKLAQANAHLERFAYLVAHDLRAPVRHIENFATIIRDDLDGELSPELRHHLGVIFNSARDMEAMIADLLEYSRTGTAPLKLAPVDLGSVVAEVREVLTSHRPDAELTWEVGPLPTITADPTQMRMLMQNLLSNAIKFSAPAAHPLIRVAAEESTADTVELTVADNGVGFDEAKSAKLFQVFSRLHEDEGFDGSGIGLANVARIVDRHHGSIRAEGRVGEGARFVVRLPRFA